MKPSESLSQFENFIANSGASLATLTGLDAVRLMLAFYREVRATDCPIDEDGDMILFQWGAYDFGEGETYRYDITRQFIQSSDDGDQTMSQLSLTVHFAVTTALRSLKQDNRWCNSPEQADDLERFIRSHEATEAVALATRLRTTLKWNLV